MRALALIVALVSASALAQPRNMNTNGQGGNMNVPLSGSVVFQLLPVVATADECSGGAVIGTRGEAITVTRSSAGYCTRSTGVLVSISANLPRVESRGLLVEAAATNLLLQNRDGSNAAWTKSSMTCLKDTVGVDGVGNSATTCTASAANGTVLQGVTAAAASRTTSVYVKRRIGTGNIDITRDNGTTWTTLTSTQCTQVASPYAAMAPNASEWVRCSLTSSVLNPTIGLRLVTSSDQVLFDLFQDEAGAYATSPIANAGTALQRTADVTSTPNRLSDGSNFCVAGTFKAGTTFQTGTFRSLLTIGTDSAANSATLQINSAGALRFYVLDGSAAAKTCTTANGPSTASYRIVACTFGGTPSVYVDGASIACTNTGAGPGTITAQPASFFLGSTTGSGGIDGWAKDVRQCKTAAGCM